MNRYACPIRVCTGYEASRNQLEVHETPVVWLIQMRIQQVKHILQKLKYEIASNSSEEHSVRKLS